MRDPGPGLAEAAARGGTGTLEDGKTFTHARYVNCVRGVATELFEAGPLSRSAMLDYIQKATDPDLGMAPQ